MRGMPERPTITRGVDAHTDELHQHPAFGQIGANRVSGKQALYGSDFLHHHFMTVTIRASQMRRGNSRDWYSACDDYIQVSLSEAQWAEFVSTPNSGTGAACTIEWVRGAGVIPGIKLVANRRDQFAAEVKRDVQASLGRLDELLAELDDAKIGARLKEKLVMAAKLARQDIEANLPFVARSFDEHMETTVARAKTEIHAYAQHAIHSAGLKALGVDGTQAPLLELVEGTENEDPPAD